MRRTFLAAFGLATLLPGIQGAAQTHKVARPEQVVRAVGVYEWTGDLKKPTASRLVPVTVFIDGAFEDAGVYLARPIPFALAPGNQYVFQQAGIARGTLDLAYARHLQTADSAYEDGWFGYGSYKALPAARKEPVLRASRNPAVLTSSKDETHPHLGSKTDATDTTRTDTAQTTSMDPQPTSPDSAQSMGKKSSDTSPAEDPDRPTMRRRSDTSPPHADTPAESTGSTPASDPDRPTLRRRSPEDAKKSSQAENNVASVTSTGSLNDDPDRPNLHRGAHAATSNTEIAKLVGVPADLKQMVAVSDAANRPPHDFARAWQDDRERATILAKMQALARSELQAYSADTILPRNPAATPVPASAAARPVIRRHTTSRPAPSSRSAGDNRASHDAALLEEDLRGYTLSYGGASTYVYSAQTSGTGADLRYVTIVAQDDATGELRPGIKNATDEAHLDRTPRMRFVDVVDAEASNRASLLFELRSQAARQFALYRVIGARAIPVFTTGTTQ